MTSSKSAARSNPHDADPIERGLLQSVVEVARSVFEAAASSVFLIDRETGEMVFEAVSGEGEGHLVGTRFPSGTGIAGWVASCGQPVLVDDVGEAEMFARRAADSTGFVPTSIMAAPLIRSGECIGVLEILDRGSRPRQDLGDVDLLGLLATEMAMGLELLSRLRWLEPAEPAVAHPDLARLRRLAERLPAADAATARTVSRLLATADEVLSGQLGDGD